MMNDIEIVVKSKQYSSPEVTTGLLEKDDSFQSNGVDVKTTKTDRKSKFPTCKFIIFIIFKLFGLLYYWDVIDDLYLSFQYYMKNDIEYALETLLMVLAPSISLILFFGMVEIYSSDNSIAKKIFYSFLYFFIFLFQFHLLIR